jgi:hypothetical protein
MNTFERAARLPRRLGTQISISLLSLALWFAACPQKLSASQDGQAQAPPQEIGRASCRERV